MKRRIVEISILFIISLLLIFYQFNQIPKNLSYDEVEFARLALHLDKVPYTPYSPLATGHSTLYFYVILFSFKLFCITSFALRIPSAVFGFLNVFLVYAIMKKIFNDKNDSFIPFLLAFIFVTLRWHFNFARYAFEATFLLFLELSSIILFLNYFKKKDHFYLAQSGFFSGLAFNSYLPGRMFFLVPLFFLAIKRRLKSIFLFIIPFLVVITPLCLYLWVHGDSRVNQQFYPVNTELTLSKKIDFLSQNTASFISSFFIKGDMNGRHNYPGKPTLNPIVGVFVILGLCLSFLKLSDFYNRFFLVYFFISALPSFLTYPWENPNILRIFTVIPSLIFFVGNGIRFLMGLKIKFSKTFMVIFIFILFAVSSFYELRTYFVYQSTVFDQAFEAVGSLKENLIRPYVK